FQKPYTRTYAKTDRVFRSRPECRPATGRGRGSGEGGGAARCGVGVGASHGDARPGTARDHDGVTDGARGDRVGDGGGDRADSIIGGAEEAGRRDAGLEQGDGAGRFEESARGPVDGARRTEVSGGVGPTCSANWST